jgi:hypothetical protein
MPIGNFKRWMQKATPDDKKQLAKGAKTTVPLLYQLTYEGQNKRVASSDLAARVEKASGGKITRGDLNPTCESCPYFKECKK